MRKGLAASTVKPVLRGHKALVFNEKFWKYLRKRNILTCG
jgi:hypothetical protein